MKLNIYEKKKIVKTYEATTYELMWGTLEDVADAVKLDDLKSGSKEEILLAVGKLVAESRETVKGLLFDIFEDLTDEELRNTHVSEIGLVLYEVVEYTIRNLAKGLGGKNAGRVSGS